MELAEDEIPIWYMVAVELKDGSEVEVAQAKAKACAALNKAERTKNLMAISATKYETRTYMDGRKVLTAARLTVKKRYTNDF